MDTYRCLFKFECIDDHAIKIKSVNELRPALSIQSYGHKIFTQGGHSIGKNTGGGGTGSIVLGLGFWSGKYILGFSKKLIWTIVSG